MENGKQAINPIDETTLLDSQGLTKREYFSIIALQGFISSSNTGKISINESVKGAIKLADELLKQLEETKC